MQRLNDSSECAHSWPDNREQENFGKACLTIVGNIHFVLNRQGFCPEKRLAAAEGVHQEFMDACLEEAVKMVIVYIEELSQIKRQASGVFPEQEVFLLAVGIGDGLTTAGIGECWSVYVGDFAYMSKEESYLNVLALVGVGIEELWEILHCLLYPFVAIQGCAEVNGGSFSRR